MAMGATGAQIAAQAAGRALRLLVPSVFVAAAVAAADS